MRRLAIFFMLLVAACVCAQDAMKEIRAVYDAQTRLDATVGQFGTPLPYNRVATERTDFAALATLLGRLQALSYDRLTPDEQLDYDLAQNMIGRKMAAHRSAMMATRVMEELPFESLVRGLSESGGAASPTGEEPSALGEPPFRTMIRGEPAAIDQSARLAAYKFMHSCTRLAAMHAMAPAFPNFADAKLASDRAKQAARIVAGIERKVAPKLDDDTRGDVHKSSMAAQAALKAMAGTIDAAAKTLPGADRTWAIGEDEFRWLITYDYMVTKTPDQLIELGWKYLRQTQADMQALARKIDPNKTIDQIWQAMEAQHPRGMEILDVAKKNMADAVELIKKEGFVTIPSWVGPCDCREVGEASAFFYPYGCYNPGRLRNGTYTGTYVVNPGYPKYGDQLEEHYRGNNIFWSRVVAEHEAWPGHHLQGGYQSAITDPIRKNTYSNAMVEGWGLYTEDLMYRHGFYPDDRYRLAQLRMRLWRCARVIIDSSIHCKGMTEEQAVDLLVKEVGLEKVGAQSEVRRYTTSPTQPSSYILGWLELTDLYDTYKAKMGAAFSERDFHDQLLSLGSLPVVVIKKRMLAAPPVSPLRSLAP